MRTIGILMMAAALLGACTRISGKLIGTDGTVLEVSYCDVLRNKTAHVNRTATGLEINYNTTYDPVVELAKQVSAMAEAAAKGAVKP